MRRLLQTGCIVLLLFAQQAALTHLLWHAKRTVVVERFDRGTAQAKRHGGTLDVAALCGFHALLGQVLGAVPCDARPQSQRFARRAITSKSGTQIAGLNFPRPKSKQNFDSQRSSCS